MKKSIRVDMEEGVINEILKIGEGTGSGVGTYLLQSK